MPFDFPSSPSEGQVYSPAGGPKFVYYAPAWRQVTTEQKIQLATAETRNRIVNGSMQHSQENGDTLVAAGSYPADQWVGAGPAGFQTARNGGTLPAQITIGGTKASVAAGDLAFFYQIIEGTRIKDLNWGLASAKQVILRFDAYAQNAGTYTASIRNAVADRSFLASFTLPVASTWTTITIVVPGDATGTWVNTTAAGMIVAVCFLAGSTFLGTAGWQAGNKVGITGLTNAFATAGGVYLRRVGLYADPNNTGVAPPWEEPDYAEELRACQRYWCTVTAEFVWSPAAASNYGSHSIEYPGGHMRAVPALAMNADGTLTAISTCSFDTATIGKCRCYATSSAAGVSAVAGRTCKVSSRM